jgi:hypothetical protein
MKLIKEEFCRKCHKLAMSKAQVLNTIAHIQMNYNEAEVMHFDKIRERGLLCLSCSNRIIEESSSLYGKEAVNDFGKEVMNKMNNNRKNNEEE